MVTDNDNQDQDWAGVRNHFCLFDTCHEQVIVFGGMVERARDQMISMLFLGLARSTLQYFKLDISHLGAKPDICNICCVWLVNTILM